MRKIKKYFLFIFVLLLAFFLTSCGKDKEEDNNETTTPEGPVVVEKYTVTWKNHDGTLLEIDYNQEKGTTPEYNGVTPTKAPDEDFLYIFDGWTPEIVEVSGDAIYQAVFKTAPRTYTVTWKNDDGSVLELDQNIERNAIPEYNGAQPTKEKDAKYTYSFKGWDKELNPVKDDLIFVAQYTETLNTYKITWLNYDGSELEVDYVAPYGSNPTYDSTTPMRSTDADYTYTFVGWDIELEEVTQDATYKAVFEATPKSITMAFDLDGGYSKSYVSSRTVRSLVIENFFFDVEKENYVFRGWSYNGVKVFDEKGNLLNKVKAEKEMTFKALYSNEALLTITTNYLDGGTFSEGGKYAPHTNLDLSAKANDGYMFSGWYVDENCLSQQEKYNCEMWSHDVVMEARFSPNVYKLDINTYKMAVGTVCIAGDAKLPNLEEDHGYCVFASQVTIKAFTLTESRFLGWFDTNTEEKVSSNAVYTFPMPAYDLSLEARWDSYDIEYVLNGGDENNELNPDTYSSSIELTLYDAYREDYWFRGWYLDEGLTEQIEKIEVGSTGDIRVYAKWEIITYSLTINKGDNASYLGEASIEGNYVPGTEIKLRLDSYDCTGIYFKDSNGYEYENLASFTMPKRHTTLTCHGYLYKKTGSTQGSQVTLGVYPQTRADSIEGSSWKALQEASNFANYNKEGSGWTSLKLWNNGQERDTMYYKDMWYYGVHYRLLAYTESPSMYTYGFTGSSFDEPQIRAYIFEEVVWDIVSVSSYYYNLLPQKVLDSRQYWNYTSSSESVTVTYDNSSLYKHFMNVYRPTLLSSMGSSLTISALSIPNKNTMETIGDANSSYIKKSFTDYAKFIGGNQSTYYWTASTYNSTTGQCYCVNTNNAAIKYEKAYYAYGIVAYMTLLKSNYSLDRN